MSLPSVENARATMLSAIVPLTAEAVPLAEADGSWLAEPVTAGRDQPPFDASAMDGWAVRSVDVRLGARLQIVGESAAGHDAGVTVQSGQAARIFTGAALPPGTDRVVIQEEAKRRDETVVLAAAPVKMRAAWPGSTVTPAPWPAALSPTILSCAPGRTSALRTAHPSMADASNGGWSRTAVIGSASQHPSASARGTASVASGTIPASMVARAVSTEGRLTGGSSRRTTRRTWPEGRYR